MKISNNNKSNLIRYQPKQYAVETNSNTDFIKRGSIIFASTNPTQYYRIYCNNCQINGNVIQQVAVGDGTNYSYNKYHYFKFVNNDLYRVDGRDGSQTLILTNIVNLHIWQDGGMPLYYMDNIY